MTTSLELGCDCLGEITYLDAVVHDSHGEPLTVRNAICIHEEDDAVLWKHVDSVAGAEVRRARRLVVSFHVTVANYEYLVYWRFYQDGNIECEVRATGIMVTTPFTEGHPPPYGAVVDTRTYAPYHQHFIVARLDLDVDGRANTVYASESQPATVGPDDPYGLGLVVRNTPLRTEADGRQDFNWATQRTWKVVNDNVTNASGTPVGYKLVPSASIPPLFDPASPVLRRAEAIKHTVWVTPVPPGRALAVRRVPEPRRPGHRSSTVDAAEPVDREHRRGALVRLRHPPHHPARGLADHAGRHGVVLAQARRLLRPQSDARRAVNVLELFPAGTTLDADRHGRGRRVPARRGGPRARHPGDGGRRRCDPGAGPRLPARTRRAVAALAVAFASKAFACTAVQRLMVSEGLWLDVAGGGEIVTALAAGADPATLVLHGNAKTTEEIELAVRCGVGTVVVDNLDDVDRLAATVPAGRVQSCLVRVIPGIQASTHAAHATGHEGSKFGLPLSVAREAIARIRGQRPAADGRPATPRRARRSWTPRSWRARSRRWPPSASFPVYDLGGGLGARYTYTDHPPSLAGYLDALIGAARAHTAPGCPDPHRAGPQPGRGERRDRLHGDHRQAGQPDVRRGRRRDGRQPGGGPRRAALRGDDRQPGRRRRAGHRRRAALRVRRRPVHRRAAARPAVGDLLVVPVDRRLLLHDVEQLQRRAAHPRRVRRRRRRAAGGPPEAWTDLLARRCLIGRGGRRRAARRARRR
jgi:hypothetical protein